MLLQYNFKKDYVVKCINANKHNHVTTSYYLLLKRYLQLGEIDDSDIEFFDDKKVAALAKSSTNAPPPNITNLSASAINP